MIAGASNDKGEDRRQFVTFRTEEKEFAADIMSIGEIRGWTATTPLPAQEALHAAA